jgi:1-acyl-sn-glycerol-3-phosphate acyltransferase
METEAAGGRDLDRRSSERRGPDRRDRLGLVLQRSLGCALVPLWMPLVIATMRFGFRWHIEDAKALRRQYARLRRDGSPLLVCANHLTLVDSFVIAWALASPMWMVRNYSSLPWNVPERSNFAASLLSRVLVYMMKCIPVVRGGDRRDIGRVLARLSWLLERGEVVLMYPEGGRSRTGRVEEDSAAYGVGRVVASVPGCRVLCVYLRGRGQDRPGDFPVRHERFQVRATVLQPSSQQRGMRRARELAAQIVRELQQLETAHFARAPHLDREQSRDRDLLREREAEDADRARRESREQAA